MKYSIIVPVFNRPGEVDELLESLTHQTEKDFEVVIVEDGSQTPCEDVCNRYENLMDIHYYYKENSGPGQSRNYGAERAKGEYLLILDSDVVLPEGYLKAVSDELSREPADAFGGPDKAHSSFTDTQKAISYSMTSFFTTGGIRGGKKKMDKFYPRSFNMGIRRDVYLKLNGFSNMRFGEDIDFSIRIFKAGCRCRLFPEAWVWHKRRTDFRKFWRQVYNSGIARINLYKKYPESLKLVHLLPMVFTVGVIGTLLLLFFGFLPYMLGTVHVFPTLGNALAALGCIGLLGVAEAFAGKPRRRGLRLIFCGSEERGLLGSKAYCAAHEDALSKIALDVNLDMIGSIMGPFNAVCTAEERLMHFIEYLSSMSGFSLKTRQDVYSSDSTPFADKGVPAVSFARLAPRNTATIHNRYDTLDVLSAAQLAQDIDFIITFVGAMVNARHFPVKREMPDAMKDKLDVYLNRKRDRNA